MPIVPLSVGRGTHHFDGATVGNTLFDDKGCAGLTCGQAECCAAPQACSASAFANDTQCAAGGDNLTVYSDQGCAGLACEQSECCAAPQVCSASAFANDTQCAAVLGSGLTLFSDQGCVGLACEQAQCCAAPQHCLDSDFASDTQCAAGGNGLTLFSDSGCAGLGCEESECCAAPQVCSASSFSDNAGCTEGAGALTLFHDQGCLGLSCLPADCCSAPQVCSASDYTNASRCELAASRAIGTAAERTVVEDKGLCAGMQCSAAECCGVPQVAISAEATFPGDAVPEAAARDTFEADFKTALAAQIVAAGGTATVDRITVDSIRVGSLIVAFTLLADQGAATTSTLSAFDTVKEAGITVGTLESVAFTHATAEVGGVTFSSAPPPPPPPNTVLIPEEDGMGAGTVIIIIVVVILVCCFCAIGGYVIYSNLAGEKPPKDMEEGDPGMIHPGGAGEFPGETAPMMGAGGGGNVESRGGAAGAGTARTTSTVKASNMVDHLADVDQALIQAISKRVRHPELKIQIPA